MGGRRNNILRGIRALEWIVAPLGLLWAAGEIRHPALMLLRPWVGLAGGATGLVLAGFAARALWRGHGPLWGRVANAVGLVAALAATATITVAETRAERLRAAVLAADPAALAAVGRHLMVTLPADRDMDVLLLRADVAGLFLTRRVTGGQSAEAIGARIAALQARRAAAGLPPLHVAADQEGGIVAGLTPPLTRPPRLATLPDDAALDAAAAATAADVRRAGITQNFAPVVDLAHDTRVEGDRYSHLVERVIARDGGSTVRVAARWCAGLMAGGVGCTLKHYPGLGRATGDTHLVAARLDRAEADDLAPFHAVPALLPRPPWIMAGHVTIVADDPRHPASASAPTIGRLRATGFDGIVVTDDATMVAYQTELAENAVASLTAGVDLILVSYDRDLVWPVLAALLEARRDGRLSDAVLAASERRLAAEWAR